MATTTVRIHPLVVDALRRLQTALETEEGLKASREDIIGALVHGATVPQAAGMLVAFTRHAAAGKPASDNSIE